MLAGKRENEAKRVGGLCAGSSAPRTDPSPTFWDVLQVC
jgi:hypothetical protein